ncbi:MAG: sulfurtransferase [Flavobacteriaceae bacterium]
MNPLVSTQWLLKHLNDPNLIILDATQKKNKDGKIEIFENQFIKNARIFDIKNEFSDTNNPFPNAFPHVDAFEKSCQEIGINTRSIIVVYDKLGIFSSPRVWWLFKTMGHQNIAILNGGLPEWIANGYTTVNIPKQTFEKGNLKATFKSEHVQFFKDIKENCTSNNTLVVDVRASNRFLSIVPEKRKNLRSGQIPGSINLPYKQVLEDGKFKAISKLKEQFKFIETDKPLIFSCGSGITACIVYLACSMVMDNKIAVYDGSWTEWATLEN